MTPNPPPSCDRGIENETLLPNAIAGTHISFTICSKDSIHLKNSVATDNIQLKSLTQMFWGSKIID